jgi:predicted flap endonuclease-1-like 5' DNA nuclease
MKAGTAIDEAVTEAPTCSRESGIMDIVDRERAEAAMGAVPNGAGRNLAVAEHAVTEHAVGGGSVNGESASSPSPPSQRDVEVDIHTDVTPSPPAVAVRSIASSAPVANSAPVSDIEDPTIEVSDDEIEAADPSLSRASLPPPPPSGAMMRSRPPAPPSSRPRPSGSSSLPPPRHLIHGSSVNGSSRPPGVDPWLLANKTLELSHAQARIAELEEQVAFRDARILELEENLAKAQRKLEDVESRSRPGAAVVAPTAISATSSTSASSTSAHLAPLVAGPERPAATETRPVAVAPSATAQEGGVREAAIAAANDDDEDESDLTFGSDDAGDSRFGGPGVSAMMRGGSDDDLQQISGIGPRFEAALRKHGVTRLSQIAAWSDADVRQVAKALKIPKSRIVKGRWVEVAREVIGTRAASE